MSADVSVIVVTYNSERVLRGCLDAISNALDPPEIIIVDNGSSDASVAIAKGYTRTRIVQGQGNVGFGAAVNLGASAAKHRLLLVMNPDCFLVSVDPAELQALVHLPNVGIRACRQSGRDATFAAWGWRAELRWSMVAWFLTPKEVSLRRPKPRPGRDTWISGAAFVVASDEFLSVGGFDETFFLYFEDFDLSRTYRLRGLPVGTTSAIGVRHAHSQSSPRNHEQMTAYGLLGLIEYAAKTDPSNGARAATEACLSWLGRIARVGKALSALPILGPRAAKKRASAQRVRTFLTASPGDALLTGRYTAARETIGAMMGLGSDR